MTRIRTIAATAGSTMALCVALASSAGAAAAPPPPGWEERRRAEACTAAPPAREVPVAVRDIPAARAGVRIRVAGLRFERALEFRYDPALGRALGIVSDGKLGLLLATDRGEWLRLPAAAALGRDLRTISAVPMVEPGRPVAQSGPIWGTSVIARADGALVSYDLGFCGFGAKPLPNGQVTDGGAVRTLAILSPWLRGFTTGKHILAGGVVGGKWEEASLALTTAPQAVTLGPPLPPPPGDEWPVALAGWDLEGGCDAARFVAQGAATRAISLCSPDFSERTVEVRGDIGFPVTRAAAGRAGAVLAEFAFPVTAASEGLILTAPEAGRFRLTVLALKTALYREDPRPR